MKIGIPELSLVVLVGPSGAGKSTFARRHFKPTEVLSSDLCRAWVCDAENDQAATRDAFDVLHFIGGKRLAAGRLTVVDATNVQEEARRPLVALARQYHCLPVAIVFDLPERLCLERNRGREERAFGPHVVRMQAQQLRRSLRSLKREGFRHVFVLSSVEEVDGAEVARVPLWNDRRSEHGPFDVIGDVHGCCDELEALLARLGYAREGPDAPFRHAEGRRAVFLGDIVDRGPRVVDSLRVVMRMVEGGTALCVPGNHEAKLLRKLKGKDVQVTHGLARTLEELGPVPEAERKGIAAFLDGLISHYVLDDGKLVVAHAGLKQEMHGRGSGRVRDFCLYGETTGETDEYGLPVRHPWAEGYRGRAMVVYGHTPVLEADWLNRTICVDTGCVFGGKLTALRYPEQELVSVAAARVYSEPARPFPPSTEACALTAQQAHDDLLHIEDVVGKRFVTTRLMRAVTVREENAVAALEVMSRFAADPRWLIYLPPTMSPCETSRREGLLEHPEEAFAHFRAQGIARVVCEEKHMGSRAVIVLCRDEEAARRRFGVVGEGMGVCVTRTGRRFFDDVSVEREFLGRVRGAASASGLWEELSTEWVCLDCELMPWSAKAQGLLRGQYAAVGSAAGMALAEARTALCGATAAAALRERMGEREALVRRYVEAYGRYCWRVDSVGDLKLAPFHLLATEGAVHVGRDHVWHMDVLARLAKADSLLVATPYKVIDLTVPASEADGVRWWEELTLRGGEGMVVKPYEFAVRGRKGLVQPALKVRGAEYLRIIYGPEYTLPENLERLRPRRLATKRSLALREFALGVEALERFVRKEPLRRVHECVFGVLALESEPVDPRL
ncbi:MAG: polynucleotide kinase-phosphatase [Planctomycetota bacterium]